MSFLDRLTEIARSLVTTDLEMKHLREQVAEVKQEFRALESAVERLGERVARLEAFREADRAEVSQFKTEVERAALRLAAAPPPRQLPPSQTGNGDE